MIHAVCFPSADPARGKDCAEKWMAKGYLPFVMIDMGVKIRIRTAVVLNCREEKFPGYYRVIGDLCEFALRYGADVVTCIGDDMDPPEQGAEYVADAYLDRFPEGLGVMQPCGDPNGMDGFNTPAAARICGSPVMGPGWIERGYEGNGPFCTSYVAFYADEDLWHVAKNLSLLELKPDMTHKHNHWSYGLMARQPYHERAQENWTHDQETFQKRQAENFPNSNPKALL